MPSITVPDYTGASLPNLVSELEHRLAGTSPEKRLDRALASEIPEASTYILLLFDGLGTLQLDHAAASPLKEALRGSIDAPFPATTTVSLATIATGLPPSQHGLLGYQLWLPDLNQVVNTIKWTTPWGEPVVYDTTPFLPSPNLWERLTEAGVEPITVQPGNFLGSPLSKALYRGCRIEPAFTLEETVDATLQLAMGPRRFIFSYLPHVDFAAHVYGQKSAEYAEALTAVGWVWEQIAAHLPDGAVMVGTADHGHIDFPKDRQAKIPKALHEHRVFYGDGRALFVLGDGASLADDLPATWFPIEHVADWWGPGPRHPAFDDRAPDGVLVADDDRLLLHRHANDRMLGNHGALTDAERMIPLLVRGL
ncbi:MAG: alkaline phosphatase family protein [Acidimicrobiia bacterium]